MAKLSERFNTEIRTYELPEEGEYKLRLKEIEPCVLEFQGKSQDKLRWKFETIGSKDCNVIDSQGKPFILNYTTGLTYTGSSKANLTKLIKGFFGRQLSLSEFADLDEQELIGKEVVAAIEVEEKETGSYPNIVTFRTIKKKAAAAPAPVAVPAPVAPAPTPAPAANDPATAAPMLKPLPEEEEEEFIEGEEEYSDPF